MTQTIVILAAGASSRMKRSVASKGLSKDDLQAANTNSKALIPVGQRPVMDFLLKNAIRAGFKRAILIVPPDHQAFKEFYGDGRAGNRFEELELNFAVQHRPPHREKPWGTADAVYQCLEQHPELQEQAFVVCNSDNLYSTQVLQTLSNTTAPNGLMAYDRDALHYPMERIARFALMKSDAEGKLLDIIEKPEPETIPRFKGADGRYRVSMNIFKFNGVDFFGYLKDCPPHPVRDEKELPTALLNMVKEHPGSVQCFPVSEAVPDLTSKEDIPLTGKHCTLPGCSFTMFPGERGCSGPYV